MANSLRNFPRTALLGVGILLLTACVSVPKDTGWPAELPGREYFAGQWQADAANQQVQELNDYLVWVRRFYSGFNLVPGWLEMMEQVSMRLPAGQWPAVENRLLSLGRDIGGEWAKNNEHRNLDTRCVAVWRDALLEALAQDDLDVYLSRLADDVSALLAGELQKDDIYFERYYVDEFDF